MKQKFNTNAGSDLSKLDAPNNWMSKIIDNTERLMIQAAAEDGVEVSFIMNMGFKAIQAISPTLTSYM